MRNRIIALVGAAAIGLAGYAAAISGGPAVAAPVHAVAVATVWPAGDVQGALVAIPASNARATFIDGNGIPHCLPALGTEVHGQDGTYPHMWFSEANPTCTFGAAPTLTVVAPPTSTTGGSASGTFTVVGNVSSQQVAVDGAEAWPTTSTTQSEFTETVQDNTASLPIGESITVTPVPVSTKGQTERYFNITSHGFKAGSSFLLTISVTDK